jgi:hypothetical protein
MVAGERSVASWAGRLLTVAGGSAALQYAAVADRSKATVNPGSSRRQSGMGWRKRGSLAQHGIIWLSADYA